MLEDSKWVSRKIKSHKDGEHNDKLKNKNKRTNNAPIKHYIENYRLSNRNSSSLGCTNVNSRH